MHRRLSSKIAADDEPDEKDKLVTVYPNPNDGGFIVEYSLDGKIVIPDLLFVDKIM